MELPGVRCETVENDAVYFNLRNFIFEIAPLYLARSLWGNGFPCAGYIVSASVEIKGYTFSTP